MNPLECKPTNIWQYKQNKPSLIAKDFRKLYGIPVEGSLKILMSRGVFKWLSIRRELIKIKNIWKYQIVELDGQIKEAKEISKINNHPSKYYRYGYLKGYKKALEECRADVRKMCHSERWRAPDFDQEALKIIEKDII
jgi:hypothetical protein